MPDELPLDDEAASLLRPALRLERFFPGRMTARNARKLFPHSALCRYAPYEVVLAQGEESKDLHVICSGSVLITKTLGSAAVHLATLAKGDIFGEIALIRDGARVANAIAAEESRVFRLSLLDVQGLMAGNAELSEHLKRLAAERAEG